MTTSLEVSDITKSPSISSLSSVNTTHSTEQLIKSLSDSPTKKLDTQQTVNGNSTENTVSTANDANAAETGETGETDNIGVTINTSSINDNDTEIDSSTLTTTNLTTVPTTETVSPIAQPTTKLPQSFASKTTFYNELNNSSNTLISNNNNTTTTNNGITNNSSTTNGNSNKPITNKKKPIKFTVRKVSHELINPSAVSSNTASTSFYTSTSHHSNSPLLNDRQQNLHNYLKKQQQQQQQQQQYHHHHHHHQQADTRKLESAQAKYSSYENRIVKIEKEIDFLTQLLPPYNVEVDYSTRVKIQNAIEKLRNKQDEIEKKKYTLGITISRLWRGHEGSEIWVRKFDN